MALQQITPARRRRGGLWTLWIGARSAAAAAVLVLAPA